VQILVVDDDPMAAEMVAMVLEEEGHLITRVNDGMAALERLGEDGFDLVISDMNMPLVSGIDLFQAMREGGVDTPFLLLTGDDPAPYLSQQPLLDGCMMKSDQMMEQLAGEVIRIAGQGQ
jgi:DNA-binding response OmpR family regulator